MDVPEVGVTPARRDGVTLARRDGVAPYPITTRVLTLLTAALMAACGTADVPATVTMRDSAGVAVIDHGRVPLDALPRLQLAPEAIVRIGVADGDEAYQFNRIADGTLRGDGSIAVIDASRTLRVFDPDGTLRWSAGRSGDGPGEFRAPLRVDALPATGEAPDTLVVWDARHGRFSRFVEATGLVGSSTLPSLAGRALWLGQLAGGEALFEARAAERTTVGSRQAIDSRSTMLQVDAARDQITELATHPQAPQYQEANDPDGAFSQAIFAAFVRYAPAGDGYWLADPERAEVQRLGLDGSRRIVRWRGDERPVTSADVDAALAVWLSAARDDAVRELIRRYAAVHPRAARFPAFDTLLVASDGALWLRDFVPEHEDDGVRHWTRITADGRAITTRLVHPASVRLLRVRGEEEVLGVERDELDVERVVRYRLQRVTGGR
jgi:hypothetical protein